MPTQLPGAGRAWEPTIKKVSIRAEQTRLHRQVWKTVTVALRGGRSSGGPYGGDVLGRVLALLAHTPALRRIPAGLQGTPASLQSTVADQYTKSVLLTPSFPHDARRSASPVGQQKNHSLSLHPQSLTVAVACFGAAAPALALAFFGRAAAPALAFAFFGGAAAPALAFVRAIFSLRSMDLSRSLSESLASARGSQARALAFG